MREISRNLKVFFLFFDDIYFCIQVLEVSGYRSLFVRTFPFPLVYSCSTSRQLTPFLDIFDYFVAFEFIFSKYVSILNMYFSLSFDHFKTLFSK